MKNIVQSVFVTIFGVLMILFCLTAKSNDEQLVIEYNAHIFI